VLYDTAGGADDLIRQIRQRPSLPLLQTLTHRITSYDTGGVKDEGVRAGERLVAALPPSVLVPGVDAVDRGFWLFPVAVDDPGAAVAAFTRRGIDAYRGLSQLRAL
jgi:hypothetical protein